MMKPDLVRSIALTLVWVVVSLGIDLILHLMLPQIEVRIASLWIILVVAVLVALGVSLAGWWRDVGYTPVARGAAPSGCWSRR